MFLLLMDPGCKSVVEMEVSVAGENQRAEIWLTMFEQKTTWQYCCRDKD